MKIRSENALEKIDNTNLKDTIISNNLRNCLIFESENKWIIEENTKYIACFLLCEKSGCLKCKTCKNILNENHPDIINIKKDKGKSELNIDKIRDLRVDIDKPPLVSEYKFYVIHDGEDMNKNAQNALLKTLENPADFSLIIILVSDVDKLLQTVVSRCMLYNFSYAICSKNFTMPKKEQDRQIVEYMVDKLGVSKSLLSESDYKFFQQAKKIYESINNGVKFLHIDIFILYKINKNHDIKKCFHILKAFLKIGIDKSLGKSYNNIDIICNIKERELLDIYKIIDKEIIELSNNINANIASSNLFKQLYSVLK